MPPFFLLFSTNTQHTSLIWRNARFIYRGHQAQIHRLQRIHHRVIDRQRIIEICTPHSTPRFLLFTAGALTDVAAIDSNVGDGGTSIHSDPRCALSSTRFKNTTPSTPRSTLGYLTPSPQTQHNPTESTASSCSPIDRSRWKSRRTCSPSPLRTPTPRFLSSLRPRRVREAVDCTGRANGPLPAANPAWAPAYSCGFAGKWAGWARRDPSESRRSFRRLRSTENYREEATFSTRGGRKTRLPSSAAAHIRCRRWLGSRTRGKGSQKRAWGSIAWWTRLIGRLAPPGPKNSTKSRLAMSRIATNSRLSRGFRHFGGRRRGWRSLRRWHCWRWDRGHSGPCHSNSRDKRLRKWGFFRWQHEPVWTLLLPKNREAFRRSRENRSLKRL